MCKKLTKNTHYAQKEVGEVTQSLNHTFNLGRKYEQELFQIPSKTFVVGKIQAKLPSPVQFYSNRCEYNFYHPYQNKMIRMVMYYADMLEPFLNISLKRFNFRIGRDLFHYGKDYDHQNMNHLVQIDLNSEHDALLLRKSLNEFLPRIRVVK